MMGRDEYGEGKEGVPRHLSNMVEAVLWHGQCMAVNGSGSRVFIDDVTADRRSRMNSDVYS